MGINLVFLITQLNYFTAGVYSESHGMFKELGALTVHLHRYVISI